MSNPACPGRPADYAHATLVLGELRDSLRLALTRASRPEAVEHLQDAQFHHGRFEGRVGALGPEAGTLRSHLYLSFNSANPPGDGFSDAIAASGSARINHIRSMLRDERTCRDALRQARKVATGSKIPESLKA